MGSLPNLSVIKGEYRPFINKKIYKIFESVASEVSSDRIAVIYEDYNLIGNNYENERKQLTYNQLNAQSNQLAREIVSLIQNHGIPVNSDGDAIIAVSMLPTEKLIITLLAIWKAGCAYLPMDPTFPIDRVQHILRESKPMLVVYDSGNDLSKFDGALSANFDDLNNRGRQHCTSSLHREEQVHEANDLSIVLYTSGSTGVPKGVRLPYTIILNRLKWQWNQFPYSCTEQYGVFKTALTFVDSVSEIWGPLLNGLTVVVVPKHITKDPAQLVQVLDDFKIERLVLVPSLLRSLILNFSLEKGMEALRYLKIWVCSGEPLPVQLAEEFFKYFPGKTLCNFYGSTEVMGDVTYYAVNNALELEDFQKVPIGVPVDNTYIYLLDGNMKPVKMGNVGELYVSGANVAAGYVNGRDPERFIDNPFVVEPVHCRLYRTGDYARIVKGQIQYEGRTDSQIKIRGHRVDLSEVEKATGSILGVEKAIVLCYKPGELEQALLAFVTTTNLDEMQIEEALQRKLPAYMIPQVILIDTVPLLVNGKIDRQSLLKMYATTNNNDDMKLELDIDYQNVPLEKMNAAKVLFETVGNVIGRSVRHTLCLQSNFYQLGGNSLNSIYTVTQLRDQGYIIGISEFLQAQNLGEVLNQMRHANEEMQTGRNWESNFTAVPLQNEHKLDVIQMIADSFYEKADLEQWLKPGISKDDYTEILEKSWKPLIEKDLSFVVNDNSGKCVGVALNFDARDEPELDINSKLLVVFEFLECLEGPVRDTLLPGGQGTVLHSFMMGTQSYLSSQENVAVMQFMEEEVMRFAKTKGFLGIFTTNTSPLTQQLGIDVYGYNVMLNYQVNQYVASDNSRPFAKAPNSQRAIVCWKPI